MLYPNVETFIGCDSSYRAASIVLYGAPYDSTTSYRPGARFGPAAAILCEILEKWRCVPTICCPIS